MKLNSLYELYLEQLRDLYDGENQIIKALPKMIDKAIAPSLKEALSEHLEVTKAHASRIEQICEKLDEKTKGETCKGMEGIIEEGSDLIGKIEDGEVRDAAIIASAQRVEHYEMAGYGTARTYASLLEEQDASQLLQETLDEEKEADETLTELARKANKDAGKASRGEKKPSSGKARRVA
jgi:ferritin-like metal-binding protein YciE